MEFYNGWWIINCKGYERKLSSARPTCDRLCGLVVRAPGYRSGFDSRCYQIVLHCCCTLTAKICQYYHLPLHRATTTAVQMAAPVRVRVTLQLTVSPSVCLGVEPNLGLLTRDLTFFFKVTVLSFGSALSDERSGLSFVSLCQYSLQWSVFT
jgi:hypothetical protein